MKCHCYYPYPTYGHTSSWFSWIPAPKNITVTNDKQQNTQVHFVSTDLTQCSYGFCKSIILEPGQGETYSFTDSWLPGTVTYYGLLLEYPNKTCLNLIWTPKDETTGKYTNTPQEITVTNVETMGYCVPLKLADIGGLAQFALQAYNDYVRRSQQPNQPPGPTPLPPD